MIVCILVLALLLPITFLPLALASYIPSALDEMGVCLDPSQPVRESTDAQHPHEVTRVSASNTFKLHAACR
jgi:hypothetical protein